ncbi:glycosyltransferase family 4 protein [Nostocoides sp. F2B08]|uniref:glycosyltransferase family 4 protein n=1 Tax=Nostocoides sp. F2B08 TaxID=2653936 RepID=UPI001D0360C8|nr:glycosyltransferase family 4 protein [Tetrasphaera sp. F2B08]
MNVRAGGPRRGVDVPLRIALTSYRSKPHSGGQGIYVRQIAHALTDLGHDVEVFSGQPYPDMSGLTALDTGRLRVTEVPSLDLYDDANPFRTPALREFRDRTDVLEFATMCTAGFPEPRTFARRVAPILVDRRHDFDVVHDNQTLAPAMLRVRDAELPLVTTLHHPISVDRRVALAEARGLHRLTQRRWFGFVRMQARVARRLADGSVITVSESSRDDAVEDFGMRPEQFSVIPVGVDTEVFAPRGPRIPGRIVCLSSADIPLKGVPVLLRAMAALPEESPAHLVVVSKLKSGGATERLVRDLDLGDRVRFVHGLSQEELAHLISSAEIGCVPSLYEGFSFPAIEAMASGCAVVASDAGALPEVVGRDGRAGLLVPAGDPGALTVALDKLLADPGLRARMGEAGRTRVAERFSWTAIGARTVEVYRQAISTHPHG